MKMEKFNIHALLVQMLVGKEVLLFVYVNGEGRESNCLEDGLDNDKWTKSHEKWAKITNVLFSDGGEWDRRLDLEVEGGESFNMYLATDITIR